MKTHLKTHKIWVLEDDHQSNWLIYPQFVHMKPMKTHLKTHKIGQKIEISHNR